MQNIEEKKMDARIGQLSNGKFYAYANGYAADPVCGNLEEVERALGIEAETPKTTKKSAPRKNRSFDVVMQFQHPAWDEVDGIMYRDIEADSKKEANDFARWMADRDGHICKNRGRYWFSATEQQ